MFQASHKSMVWNIKADKGQTYVYNLNGFSVNFSGILMLCIWHCTCNSTNTHSTSALAVVVVSIL